MIKNPAHNGIFYQLFAPVIFIVLWLFPSMAFIEIISLTGDIFHVINLGTWLPVALFVAGVHGPVFACMHANVLRACVQVL